MNSFSNSHYWLLDGHEFEQAPGVGDGQGGLACCSPWGRKESDTIEWLNWTELNWSRPLKFMTEKQRLSFTRAVLFERGKRVLRYEMLLGVSKTKIWSHRGMQSFQTTIICWELRLCPPSLDKAEPLLHTCPPGTSASSAGNRMSNAGLAAWLPGLGMFLAQPLAPIVSFPACPGPFWKKEKQTPSWPSHSL